MDPIITKMLEGVPYSGMGSTLERNALIGVVRNLISEDKHTVDYILSYCESVGYQRQMAEDVFKELTGLSPALIVNNNAYYDMPSYVPNMCIAWGIAKGNKEKAFYIVPFEYGYAVMEKDEINAPIPTVISATIPEAFIELKKVAKNIQTLDKIITKKLLETENVQSTADNVHQVNLPYSLSPLQVLKKNFKDKVLSISEFEKQASQLVQSGELTVDEAEDLMTWKQDLIDEDESYANDTLQLDETWKPLEAEEDEDDYHNSDEYLNSYEYLYSQLVNGNLDLYREKLNKLTKKQLIEYVEWANEMGIGREELKLNKYVQSGKKKVVSKIDTLKDRLNFGHFDDETTLPKFNSLDELENYIRETNSFPDNFFYKGGLFTMSEYDMNGIELIYQSPELGLEIVVKTPTNRYNHKGNYTEMEMDIYEDEEPFYRTDITYFLPKDVYEKLFGKSSASKKVISTVSNWMKERLLFNYFSTEDEKSLPKFKSLKDLENYIRQTNSFPSYFFYKGGLFTEDEYDMEGLVITYASPEIDVGIVVNTPDNRYDHKGNYKNMDISIEEDGGPLYRTDVNYYVPKSVYDSIYGNELESKKKASKKVTAENMTLDDIEAEDNKDEVTEEIDKINENPVEEIFSETTPEEYFEDALSEDKVDTINEVVSRCIDKFSEKFKDFDKYNVQILSYNTKVLGDYEPVEDELVEDKELNANAILQVILAIKNKSDESDMKKALAVFSVTNGELHWTGTIRGENDQIVAFTEEGLDSLFEVEDIKEEELEDII